MAAVIEAVGLLVASAAVGMVAVWAGLLVFGVGLIAFGVAMEWGDG